MVGKRVGTKVYAHVSYAGQVVPAGRLAWAIRRVRAAGVKEPLRCDCIRYDVKDGSVAFQWSPDFDKADEPTVGDTVLVKADGSVRTTRRKADPQVWHHKWMWVDDRYRGFNRAASRARSEMWSPLVTPEERRRIGTRSYWDKIRARWE